ncbi:MULTISPECIES: cupredoxin domain-containing protein [unclassified Streptomyces]|uniref:cupredoxin domain-containing protein n=1 Tax=unclassified Streptomyces TaxID=2593676 RepID=UPI001F04B236|nr:MULTISPECIES: cupredoxin domain-containing protein [unclassified Streptomyces]MCH0566584.1 cupredoxin domain-containing protein [Streptomyces sp. MUM 2J]MCH0572178.1 cupredoxin domain-containing protein [Streptomyces sp. MUM 136J]
MRTSRTLPALGAALLALPLLAACGSKDSTGSGSDKVAITATDTACEVAKTELKAGETSFTITNKGDRATEVYVYGEHDGAYTRIVTEVENIGPGTTRRMEAKLGGGTYEIACKPGQAGDGIRQRITVEGAEAGEDAAQESYDREVEVKAGEYALEGLGDFTAKAGEKVEFKLENGGTTEHELEIFGPDGKEVGEVGPVEPGATGEAVITLAEPGTYTYECGIGTHADKGMKGSFTVG